MPPSTSNAAQTKDLTSSAQSSYTSRPDQRPARATSKEGRPNERRQRHRKRCLLGHLAQAGGQSRAERDPRVARGAQERDSPGDRRALRRQRSIGATQGRGPRLPGQAPRASGPASPPRDPAPVRAREPEDLAAGLIAWLTRASSGSRNCGRRITAPTTPPRPSLSAARRSTS